ncbi:MAG: type 4a pilus biogenesis protein PilO [Planctomycetota bacterium]
MAKLNEKQRIWVTIGGGLLLSAAAGGGIWWTQGLIEEVKSATAQDQTTITEDQKKIERINALESSVIVLRENIDTYSKILPNDTEVNDFVRVLNRFATAADIEFSETQVGQSGKGAKGKYSHYSYRIELTASLWQFLKFTNLLESHDRFIRIVSFNLKGAERDEIQNASQRGSDARHKISMVIETFVYAGAAAAKNVEIPGYGRKRDRLEAEIARGTQAVSLERYDYIEKIGRRDIFVDPRPTVGGGAGGDTGRHFQKQKIDEYLVRVNAAKEIFERWKQPDLDYVSKETFARRLRESLTALDQEVAAVTPRISNPQLVAEWSNSIVQPMREMWRGLRGDQREVQQNMMTEERMRALLGEMSGAVARGEIESAMKLFDDNADRLRFPEDDPRYVTSLEIRKVREAIQIAREFSDIPMKIEGVVVVADGRSGILINGRVFEEGEYLDNDLLVKTVGAEQADFVFKGFVLRRKW